eukprot:SAG25_NODE_9297_length_378_cov_1.458781_1_plen_73_part_01
MRANILAVLLHRDLWRKLCDPPAAPLVSCIMSVRQIRSCLGELHELCIATRQQTDGHPGSSTGEQASVSGSGK